MSKVIKIIKLNFNIGVQGQCQQRNISSTLLLMHSTSERTDRTAQWPDKCRLKSNRFIIKLVFQWYWNTCTSCMQFNDFDFNLNLKWCQILETKWKKFSITKMSVNFLGKKYFNWKTGFSPKLSNILLGINEWINGATKIDISFGHWPDYDWVKNISNITNTQTYVRERSLVGQSCCGCGAQTYSVTKIQLKKDSKKKELRSKRKS